MCWGNNEYGQLGINAVTAPKTSPTGIYAATIGSVLGIDAGMEHTCAINTSGNAFCWGRNNFGQLGVATSTTYYHNPRSPTNSSGVVFTSISAGHNHVCAARSGGGAYCWGLNDQGQLGDGTISNKPSMAPVSNLTVVVSAISGGHQHTCAIKSGGELLCWGYNVYGQLGDGTTTRRTTPVDVRNYP